MKQPICYDLYCGLGGWTEAFIEEGYRCIGFDIEAHDYGTGGYPGELRIRDVRSIHGSELKDAAVIVGSSPCQEFSYRAMPWKRAKALPPPYLGMELFNAQFRIQREACEAAGRHIPMVVENVRGAQKWVGRARWNYGSFYLWGDVPALMPKAWKAIKGIPHKPTGHWTNHAENRRCICPTECDCANPEPETGVALCSNACPIHNVHADPVDGCPAEMHKNHEVCMQDSGRKVSMNFHEHEKTGKPERSFQSAAVEEMGVKGIPHRTKGHWTNPAEHEGTKGGGDWFSSGAGCSVQRRQSSKSSSRKLASAMIAKIPRPLALHIARAYKPVEMAVTA